MWTEDVDQENARLTAQNQQLLAELDAGQKREAELIEHLVTAQLRIDKLQAIRLAQKKTIADLKHGTLSSRSKDVPLGNVTNTSNKELATSIRIRELEREVDFLTAHVEELSSKSQSKAVAWRYIEAQQDSLKAREELAKTRTLFDDLKDELDQAQAANNLVQRELSMTNAELASTKRAHEEHAKRTKEQIGRLMKQIRAERRKAVHETREEIKQLDQVDSEERQQAIEELRNEVGWLKYLSTVLQETCDNLKQEHEKTRQTEATLVRTKSELRHVRRELATIQLRMQQSNPTPEHITTGSGTLDRDEQKSHDTSVRNPLLQLKMENHKLHKLVQLLRTRLTRTAPAFQGQYQFVSGV
ncbi:unnamed protein product [Echinostoma caproni]|uniref:Cilia- and flagella-associated protein 157 n=1 Tax=Echinostoma caproni TaxID=27848 RepID=A0A183AR83_9TREM|nr:unnamed protein product [Echinostoma caproni]